MRDFNFFSGYVSDKKKNQNERLYVVIIISFTLLMVLGSLGYNLSSMYMVKKDIKELKVVLDDKENQVLLKKAETLNYKGQILSKYLEGVNIIWKNVDESSIVSGEIITNISKNIPKEVSFKSMSIDVGSISIQGVSKSRTAIAELEKNLKGIENIERVHIPNINSGQNKDSNQEYSFSLSCSLKGAEKNENKK